MNDFIATRTRDLSNRTSVDGEACKQQADAMAEALAAPAGGGVVWVLRLVPKPLLRVLVRLWQRHGHAVWPPRRETAHFYLGGWGVLMAVIYLVAIRTSRSKEAEWESNRKRSYAEASLRNLLKYEEQRVLEEKEEKATADKCDTGSQEVAQEDAEKEKKEKADEIQTKDSKKKEPPDAKRMLELLYDEVESGSITKLGVDARSDWYRSAVALLKERVEIELREAIDKTIKARGVMLAESNDPTVLSEMDEWQDGDKLTEKVKMVKDRVYKGFGKKLVDPKLMKEAKTVLSDVANQQKMAIARVWRLFKPYAHRWVAGTLILMCTECSWGFLQGNLVALTTLAYDLKPDTLQRAARWIGLIGAGYLFNWPFDNLGDTLVDGVESKLQLELRQAVMKALLSQDREYFDHHQTGVLQERLNSDTEKLASTIIQQPKNLISAITRVVVKSIFLHHASPSLFWTGICIPVPFCVIFNTLAFGWVRKADQKISKVNDHANGSTSEILREINTVRQFGMEREESRRYGIIARWREQLEFSMRSTQRICWFSMWMAWVASQLFNTYRGISLVIAGQLEAAQLAIAIYQFDGIVWGVRQVVDMVPAVAQLMQPLTRVASLLNTIPKIEPHEENMGLNLAPEKFVGKIEFREVDFTYPSERQKQVLFGLSFTVEPQTKVAFVGKAGCGKSTSVTLIQRFYNATKGTVMLDDHPITDYDLHHLRRNIGVVAQDNVLFSTSLYENIVYGMGQGHLKEPSMEDVWAACDAANVTEFVRTFPNGLHTFIGEKGVKLSGGQKQRLAIARAIIRQPTILLLDEATSALDSVNEKEVQKALDSMLTLHRGVAIVIAHRLTTIKNCDKIIVMDKGKKVEEGTHAELMQIDVIKGKPAKKSGDDPEAVAKTDEQTKTDDKTDETGGGHASGLAKEAPVDEEVTLSGFYHLMWDTQMGEETFADAKLMTDEQLEGKLSFHASEVTRLEGEVEARKVTPSKEQAE